MGSREVLTKRQRDIIIGTLLGDACLEKNGNNYQIRIEHGEKYKDYIRWLSKELQPFTLITRYVSDPDRRNGKVYHQWHVSTRSLPIFKKYAKLFYKARVKKVPINFIGY